MELSEGVEAGRPPRRFISSGWPVLALVSAITGILDNSTSRSDDGLVTHKALRDI